MKSIKRYIGELLPFEIRAWDPVRKAPVSIAGCTISIRVKLSADDLDSAALFIDADVPHINDDAGLARTADIDFTTWAADEYLFQAEIEDAAGKIIMSDIASLVVEASLKKTS